MTDREALTGAASWLRWLAKMLKHDSRLTDGDRRELATLNARLLMMSQTVEIENRAIDLLNEICCDGGPVADPAFVDRARDVFYDLAAVDPDANLKDEEGTNP